MTDKVLCPWCGAEMKEHLTCASGGYPAWLNYKCKNIWCSAVSPYGDTREEAHTKALRRYTPPIKPMTFEEVERLACSDSIDDETPLYLEDVDGDNGWEISYQLRRLCFNAKDDYGKTWRCWERKPTDEERSEAGWET